MRAKRRARDEQAGGSGTGSDPEAWAWVEGERVDEGDGGDARALLVFTSSYGLSALIHGGILLIFLFIVWAKPPEKEVAKELHVSHPLKPEKTYNPDVVRAMRKKPPVENQERVDKPVIRPVEEPNETPKGDPRSASERRLSHTDTNDAIGPGGGHAGPYGHRWGSGRGGPDGCGTPETESAVTAALWWLQRHQGPDGSWSASGFSQQCDAGRTACRGDDLRSAGGVGPGAGDPRYDLGVTSLALLAFLGDGHSHRWSRTPEFRRAVKGGVRYLRTRQLPDGSIGFHEGEDIYNHAIATLALCETYAMSRDFTYKGAAQRAVDWLVKAQNPGLGWQYGVQPGKNDTSVTGWAVLALKAAKVAKLRVPDSAFAGALAWIERATSDGAGPDKPPGLVGYQRPADGGSQLNRRHLEHPDAYPRFEGAPTMTGVALLCRIFLGQSRQHPRVQQGLKVVMGRLPRWDGPAKSRGNQTNFYYWYYGTYGVFQATRLGSKEWDRWNAAMQVALLGDGMNRQRMGADDDANGSWDPVGEWGIPGGRVYATAINALTLEIYYRYERAKEAVQMPKKAAARSGG